MTDKTPIQALEEGFYDELTKIAAARRENAHNKGNRTKTRAGKRPIRAAKLVKESAGITGMAQAGKPVVTEVLKNPYFWGAMTGIGGTIGAQQVAKDYSTGRKIRKMQRQQARMR